MNARASLHDRRIETCMRLLCIALPQHNMRLEIISAVVKTGGKNIVYGMGKQLWFPANRRWERGGGGNGWWWSLAEKGVLDVDGGRGAG